MLHFIQRLQKESLKKRRKVALYGAIVITFMVLVIWLVTLAAKLSGFSNQAGEGLESPKPQNVVPFNILKNDFSLLWKNLFENTNLP